MKIGRNRAKTHEVMVIFKKYFVSILIIVDYTILPNFSPIGALFGILLAKNPEMTSNLPLTSIFLTQMSGFRENRWIDFSKILSKCQKHFLAHFVKILDKSLEWFFRKVPKTPK